MSNGTLQSLDRGLLVLELLSQAEHGLSLQELCDRLGMKPPTMHNLLRTLAARGYVDKTRRPVRYRLGSGPQVLVQRQSRRGLLTRVEAALGKLASQLPVDQVQYAEAVGGEVVTVRRVSKSQPGLVQQPHRQLSLYNSASGLLFQAYWPAEELDAYRRRYPFDEYAGRAWSSVDALRAYLVEVRRLGYAIAPGKQPSWAMAVPVTDAGELVGALGTYRSGERPLPEDEQQRCIELMTAMAGQLSAPANADQPD